MLTLAWLATAVAVVSAQLNADTVSNSIDCMKESNSVSCSYNAIAASASDCRAIASGLGPNICDEKYLTAQQTLDCANGLTKSIANCNYAFNIEGSTAFAFTFGYQAFQNVTTTGPYTPPTFDVVCTNTGGEVCSVSVQITETQDCAYLRSKCLTDGATEGFCNGLPTDKPSIAFSLHMQCVERYNFAVDRCFEWMYQGLGPTTFNLSFNASLTASSLSSSKPMVADIAAAPASGTACWAAYNSANNYPINSQVSYNGVNYQNQWWENAGYSPDPSAANNDKGWVSKGSCSGSAPTTTMSASTATGSSSPSSAPSSYSDGSVCVTGPGLPSASVVFEITTDSTTLYTATTCNAACVASGKTGITYSGMVQMGGFVSCYCFLNFTPSPATNAGCSSCVTYPNHVGYPQSNFANCGEGNDSNGALGSVAVLPIQGSSAANCWTAYDSATNYAPNSKVSYNGVNYLNKWWENAGYSPDPSAANTDHGWTSQGSCTGSGNGTPTSAATTTTTGGSASSPTVVNDGSTCSAGPGTGSASTTNAFQISTSNVLYTAATCNAACVASGKAGVTYSGLVQMGGFVSCYCFTTFTPSPPTNAGCSPCITYPGQPGYPQSNLSMCGEGNVSDGAIASVSYLPVKGSSGTTCWTAYDSTTNYAPNSKVSYNGVNYQNKWWENAGYSPDPSAANTDHGWASQGSCGGSGSGTPSSAPTTTSGSPSAPTTGLNDGSTCVAGPDTGSATVNPNIFQVQSSTMYTASTCNAACVASGKAGVNYSGLVQMGGFVSCYCLINFKPTTTTGCSACMTYPGQPGYPQSNFANCGTGNDSDGAVSSFAALPVNSMSGTTCYTAYDPSTNYPANSKVSYNNINWINKWWENAGYYPNPNAANYDWGWTPQGPCNAPVVAAAPAANADIAKGGVYNPSGNGAWF